MSGTALNDRARLRLSPARFAPVLLFALVALLAACAGRRPAPAPAGDTLVLVSIDAFRADYLDRGITPGLSRIAREGVHAWMSPSYPSLTFPNHYTLVTGLRPDRHGIVHNTMRDPVLGDFRPQNIPAVRDARWWQAGTPIWATAERAGLRTASWAWPGSLAPVDGAHPWRAVPFDETVPPAARVDAVLQWLSLPPAQRPRLVTLYFDGVDHAGHDFGPDSPQVDAALRDVDAAIGRLVEGLAARGELDRTNLVVVSDHGMAAVPPGQAIAVEDMVSVPEAVVTSVGQVINVWPNRGHEAGVAAKLLGAHDHYDCWRKDGMPARWRFGTNPRIAPIVCQMRVGWDAIPREDLSKRPAGHPRGSHGYDPALPQMRAIFLARGPAFRAGVELPGFDNVDVYPLLARLLGIAPLPNDGDIAPLLPALRDTAP